MGLKIVKEPVLGLNCFQRSVLLNLLGPEKCDQFIQGFSEEKLGQIGTIIERGALEMVELLFELHPSILGILIDEIPDDWEYDISENPKPIKKYDFAIQYLLSMYQLCLEDPDDNHVD